MANPQDEVLYYYIPLAQYEALTNPTVKNYFTCFDDTYAYALVSSVPDDVWELYEFPTIGFTASTQPSVVYP